jgi:hypothetical protein
LRTSSCIRPALHQRTCTSSSSSSSPSSFYSSSSSTSAPLYEHLPRGYFMSCGHVRSRFECFFSLTLLPGPLIHDSPPVGSPASEAGSSAGAPAPLDTGRTSETRLSLDGRTSVARLSLDSNGASPVAGSSHAAPPPARSSGKRHSLDASAGSPRQSSTADSSPPVGRCRLTVSTPC